MPAESVSRSRSASGRIRRGKPLYVTRVRASSWSATRAPASAFPSAETTPRTSDPGEGPAFPAEVVRIHAAGPHVRVELKSEFGDVRAVIGHEQLRELALTVGKPVWVGLLEHRVVPDGEEARSA